MKLENCPLWHCDILRSDINRWISSNIPYEFIYKINKVALVLHRRLRSFIFSLKSGAKNPYIKQMATMEKGLEFENKNLGLKHLNFVRVATIHALVCVSNLYDYSKQNSGPLRSAVDAVESAVTTAVCPVYGKFKDVPDHFLGFLDDKVDKVSHKFDEHAPAPAKQVVNQAHYLVQKATQKAQKLVEEARTNGARGALHYAAAEYKNLVLVSSTKLWVKLNRNSTFKSVTEKVVPKAANLCEKYNSWLKEKSGKGYPVVGYLPSIPVDAFGKAVKEAEGKEKANADDHKSESDSD
ncbi:hypothetical protein Golob_026584 [Gossypium lobatum]|uniref:REF/SRPP-like protein At1g67360 n=1 Tax=Gossypium lobatum TaxID=34289 RepID=A0A7J8LVK0_9ROSI|nr:hypothetical protein [Gossypium lobatum]